MDTEEVIPEEFSTQPIAKRTVFWMFVRWFGPAFLGALGVIWLILEPLNFWQRIFQPGRLSAWIFIILLSTSIAVAVACSRLAIYYRCIYRMYRNRALVDNLYEDRSTLQGKYANLIANSHAEVLVSGISLHTLLQNPDTRAAIVKAACEKKVRFRFLLHHPKCRFIRDRAQQEGKKENHIAIDCEQHLKQLNEIKKDCEARGGSIEIRTIKDKMPDCFFFKVDETLFIEPYLLGYTGRDCPVFSLKKNQINTSAFDSFVRRIEHKWEKLSERHA
jgi:hypothetical protein